jgi:hypothetical protein
MFRLIVFLVVVATPVWVEAPEDVQVRIFNSFLRTGIEGDSNSQFVVGHRYALGQAGHKRAQTSHRR